MKRDCNIVHIRCHSSHIGMKTKCVARGKVLLDNKHICTDNGLGSAHKELEVKVCVKTGVRVHSVVNFGRHGNVEEKEIVIEVLMSEGVR